jgi:tetratricopeptide (TPR) repeat protein
MGDIKRLSIGALTLLSVSSWFAPGDAQTGSPAATSTPAITTPATSTPATSTPATSTPGANIAGLCITRPGSAGVPATLADWADGAQLFDGLGDFHRPVTTTSLDAQRYFDQGMRLLWAFNHDESTRSFAKAAMLDPQCAMCFWGVALTVGPNYNLPMMAASRAQIARNALERATALAPATTPVEQALIAALGARYPDAKPLDPSNEAPILIAYAQRMRDVAGRFPDDSDVQTLTAEALMNVNAWKLWTPDGTPAAGTLDIVARLEGVLAKDPRHPGANHYYIHTMEASQHPEAAVTAAERLAGMMPAAGHLEHMPAHIMQRVGRYADAAEANRKGAAADLAYFAKTRPLDYYAMYTAHNYQFLAFSTAMQGRRADTLDATRKSRAIISDELLAAMPGLDWYVAETYAAMVRFGMWQEILAEPAPNPQLIGLSIGYRYGRANALAATGHVADARSELAELETRAAAVAPADGAGLSSAADVSAVAVLVAKARIADAEGNDDAAITLLTEAAAKEDALPYDEPSDWFFPTRHLLGAALLRAGRAQDAEAVYREDLRRHPENGWALFGLSQSLAAQHKDADAQQVRLRFDAAWKDADVGLTASAF